MPASARWTLRLAEARFRHFLRVMSTKTQTKARQRYGCSRCGKTVTSEGDPFGWLIRGPRMVVCEVTIGTCVQCIGKTPFEKVPDACAGDCGGRYTGDGPYWAAQVRFGGWRTVWSCWDEACVNKHADEFDDFECECPRCPGDHFDDDIRVVEVASERGAA